jgi:transposase
MSSKQEQQRQQILGAVVDNPGLSHREIAKLIGIHHSTVSRVIAVFRKTKTTERRAGSGRKSKTQYPEKARKVRQQFKRNPNLSTRDVAAKVDASKWFVQKTIKRAGLSVFKVRKAPNRTDKQNTVGKQRARKLYREWLTKPGCLVMDDETYIKADTKQLPGLEYYIGKSRFEVPERFRKKKLDKFAKKFLLWQAICSCGQYSKPYVTTGTINGQIYREECLQKRLLPFLRSHRGPTLFWPDLASCHYAKQVMEWYEENDVVVVPKEANPPNAPELRPIEKFWAIMKAKVKKSGKMFKTGDDLKKKWEKLCEKEGERLAQGLMSSVKRKVRAYSLGKEIE